MPNRRLVLVLRVLLVMIVGLMALGAGVRAMNAGLSCPDWPLCFGKVIPDFHPGVWFEFVHRAYAGLVALVFAGSCLFVLFSRAVPRAAKRAAVFGVFFLFMQIAAGALTVLWKVKAVAVTSHLMLATMFFCSVLWMLLAIDPRVKPAGAHKRCFLPRTTKTLLRGVPVVKVAGSARNQTTLGEGVRSLASQGNAGKTSRRFRGISGS